jgi:hypothetical protein
MTLKKLDITKLKMRVKYQNANGGGENGMGGNTDPRDLLEWV